MEIKGPGYVFETQTLNYGGAREVGGLPKWYLKISAAGTFTRDEVEALRDMLTEWLLTHEK